MTKQVATETLLSEAFRAAARGEAERTMRLILGLGALLDDEAPEVNTTAVPEALPPIKPIKAKRRVRAYDVKALDVECPVCGAMPDEPCVRMSTRGPHGKPTDEPLTDTHGTPTWHRRRAIAAKEALS